jgi:hypothetical protein
LETVTGSRTAEVDIGSRTVEAVTGSRTSEVVIGGRSVAVVTCSRNAEAVTGAAPRRQLPTAAPWWLAFLRLRQWRQSILSQEKGVKSPTDRLLQQLEENDQLLCIFIFARKERFIYALHSDQILQQPYKYFRHSFLVRNKRRKKK